MDCRNHAGVAAIARCTGFAEPFCWDILPGGRPGTEILRIVQDHGAERRVPLLSRRHPALRAIERVDLGVGGFRAFVRVYYRYAGLCGRCFRHHGDRPRPLKARGTDADETLGGSGGAGRRDRQVLGLAMFVLNLMAPPADTQKRSVRGIDPLG